MNAVDNSVCPGPQGTTHDMEDARLLWLSLLPVFGTMHFTSALNANQ